MTSRIINYDVKGRLLIYRDGSMKKVLALEWNGVWGRGVYLSPKELRGRIVKLHLLRIPNGNFIEETEERMTDEEIAVVLLEE